jgi:hypothetical protein
MPSVLPRLSWLLEQIRDFMVDDASRMGMPLRRLGGLLFTFVGR